MRIFLKNFVKDLIYRSHRNNRDVNPVSQRNCFCPGRIYIYIKYTKKVINEGRKYLSGFFLLIIFTLEEIDKTSLL